MTLSVDLEATFSADGTEPFRVSADFSVQRGETVVILGPSGSGKSLLLETIAGFHDHDGRITDGDGVLSDRPPEGRDFGFVFQDYALFPHMTVRENLEFGQRYRAADVDPGTLLADLGVADLAERYPPTLSGGERQRVALARALAVDPSTLLLDEPLSSLDVPTRQSLRDDLQDVLAGMTAIYVTHDRTTARALADRIVVMHDGEVVQTGTPEDVFQRPASPLVARFTGSNCLPVAALNEAGPALGGGDATHLAIRPEDVEIGTRDADLSGTVERVTREDATSRVTVAVEGLAEPIAVYSDDPPAPGSEVNLRFPRDRVSACQA